jgi:hypothetical protein
MEKNKPWEIKVDDIRELNNLYTFIIFCEDEVSEYIYFKWFETSLIKINIINKQKSMMSNVVKAINYCQNNQFLIQEDGKYLIESEGIEVWCVYDRDLETDANLIQEKNIEFNLSISTASDTGINVAWSNDAFELWILLHFSEVNPLNVLTTERKYYYDQLTEIFKNLPNPNIDLQKALVHASFNYKKDLKQKNNFKDIVRPIILPKTNIAIQRAKALVEYHIQEQNHYDKKPCTLVYKLIERIIEKGGKEIPIE